MKDIGKPANHRCEFQSFAKGCRVYAHRPFSCRVWSCSWFLGDSEEAKNLRRPDHCHYCVDPMPDFVTVFENGVEARMDIIQVWVDAPYAEEIYRDPPLLAFIEARNMPALLRVGAQEVFMTIIPPKLMSNGQWFFRRPQPGDSLDPEPHSALEVFA